MTTMATLLLLLTLFTLSRASDMSILNFNNNNNHNLRTDEEVNVLYESWLVQHGKTYNALGEKDRRFEIFKDNLRFIDQHNSADRSYKVGLNKFADLTNEEYRTMYTGVKKNNKNINKVKSDRYVFRSGESLPESVDWREKGAVASVKDQGSC
ncbi:low-temperature-induced cysteine proteinase-like protein, partial [Tanacetum coccineum]